MKYFCMGRWLSERGKGIAPQTIKRMMRWSTTKMLDRYAHPDDADVINAANTIRRIDT